MQSNSSRECPIVLLKSGIACPFALLSKQKQRLSSHLCTYVYVRVYEYNFINSGLHIGKRCVLFFLRISLSLATVDGNVP